MKTSVVPIVALTILSSALSIHAASLPVAEDSSSSRGKLTGMTNKASTLRVDAKHTAYIYFDLRDLPVTMAAQIRSARLRIYTPKVDANGGGLTVHLVKQSVG